MGLLRAIMDGILGEVDLAGGRSITRLVAPLTDSETSSMEVESTLRFGEFTDGASDARLLINGEIVTATGRTTSSPYTFTTLTRGVDGTNPTGHPAGTLVMDLSENRTALDLVRRGFLVDYATGNDLDTIARNLGLRKCPGLAQEAWRRIIKATAFLPKSTVDSFEQILEAYFNDTSSWEVFERLVSNPYKVFVDIETELATSAAEIRGRFVLSGGLEQVTDGSTQVTVTWNGADFDLQSVAGVFLATEAAKRGYRDGLTNYFTSGSFTVGSNVITLGSSPGSVGTEVIVDAIGYSANDDEGHHYLAEDITQEDENDRYAYLSDPLLTVRCLLDHVRPAGTQVELRAKL